MRSHRRGDDDRTVSGHDHDSPVGRACSRPWLTQPGGWSRSWPTPAGLCSRPWLTPAGVVHDHGSAPRQGLFTTMAHLPETGYRLWPPRCSDRRSARWPTGRFRCGKSSASWPGSGQRAPTTRSAARPELYFAESLATIRIAVAIALLRWLPRCPMPVLRVAAVPSRRIQARAAAAAPR